MKHWHCLIALIFCVGLMGSCGDPTHSPEGGREVGDELQKERVASDEPSSTELKRQETSAEPRVELRTELRSEPKPEPRSEPVQDASSSEPLVDAGVSDNVASDAGGTEVLPEPGNADRSETVPEKGGEPLADGVTDAPRVERRESLPELVKEALPEGKMCIDASQCGTPSCQGLGKDCIQNLPVCTQQGACVVAKTTFKSATCVGSTGLCQRVSCAAPTDCGSTFCLMLSGECNELTPTCDFTQQCSVLFPMRKPQSRCDYQSGRCVAFQCTKASDCGQNSCEDGPDRLSCTENKAICNGGRCSKFSRKLKDYTCNKATNDCDAPKSCTQTSDCGAKTCFQRGRDCYEQTFKCDQQLCSKVNSLKAQSKCDASTGLCKPVACTKDSDCSGPFCEESNGSCTGLNSKCESGVCVTRNVSMAKGLCDKRSQQCVARKSCQSASACGKSTCQMSDNGTFCQQFSWLCSNGHCYQAVRSNSGMMCNQATGLCEPKSCTTSADCPASFCEQGAACFWSRFRCASGKCVVGRALYSGATCNASKTACEQSCRIQAECGNANCYNAGDNCVQLFPACGNGRCLFAELFQTNAQCVATNPFEGSCVPRKQCSKDSDCGTNSCTQSKGLCLSKSFSCRSGYCHEVERRVTGSLCSPSSGTCSLPGSCQKDADCLPTSCRKALGDCFDTLYRCINNVCVGGERQFVDGTCQSGGTCKGKQCSAVADCGKPKCRSLVGACLQQTPTCSGGTCGVTLTHLTGKLCNSRSGLCEACAKDSDCPAKSCTESNGRCGQKSYRCVSGVCQRTSASGRGTCDTSTNTCAFK